MIKHLKLVLFLMFAATTLNVQAELKEETVSYEIGGEKFSGYLVYDDRFKGKRPGVLVVHEWWGHNDYARKRARMLAENGYVAFAIDMYGEGKVTEHPGTAKEFATVLWSNMDLSEERFRVALDMLTKHNLVDSDNIGAIGYCFGGGIVLEMARRGLPLKGVVSFHGGLKTETPAKPGKVQARVLVLNGQADPMIKSEDITNFEKEMKNAGVDYQIIHYPGAKHAFTNPLADEFGKKYGIPLAYNKQADEDSWAKMQAFLKQIFAK